MPTSANLVGVAGVVVEESLLKPTLVATSQGQGGKERTDLTGVTVPIKLTGPIASPDYSLDFAGMASDVIEALPRALSG